MRGVFRFGVSAVSTAVLAVILTAPHVAHAATITVNTLNDENDGSCTDGDCSLRDAVQVANPGDVITFGVTGTITLTGGEMGINKDLSIVGPGAGSLVISGEHHSRVFNISSGSVSISGLTIRDGFSYAPEGGGGILNQGVLTLAGSVVTANSTGYSMAAGWGGGIHNMGSLTITNSTISGNWGGSGGGVYVTSGTVTISSSTISGNEAVAQYGGYGGGVANISGTVLVRNSTITGNTARNYGGGIFQSFSGAFTITCSHISGNTTDDPNSYDAYVALPGGVLQTNGNWWGAATGPNTPGADTTNAAVSDFLTAPATCGGVDQAPDDRIDWKHGDSYAIIYPRQDEKGKPDLHFYCVDLWGNGTLGLIVTQEMIDKAPKTPSKNTEIASTNQCRVPVKLFVLTTGEYQANIGPDIEGKVDVVIFTGLPPTHIYYKHFNIYDLFR